MFYYYNADTRTSQWTRPVVGRITEQWARAWSDRYHMFYYYNADTRTSQWTRPVVGRITDWLGDSTPATTTPSSPARASSLESPWDSPLGEP